MKKWLNKPPVVAALAVIAIGIVYFNIIRPLSGPSRSTAVSTAMPAMLSKALPDRLMMHDAVATSSSTADVDWTSVAMFSAHAAGRVDPFRPFVPVLSPEQPYEYDLSESTMPDDVTVMAVDANASEKHNLPAIRAIIIGSMLKYAMIGSEIVQEGDSIDGYKVVSISNNLISLHGPAGAVQLYYDRQGED